MVKCIEKKYKFSLVFTPIDSGVSQRMTATGIIEASDDKEAYIKVCEIINSDYDDVFEIKFESLENSIFEEIT